MSNKFALHLQVLPEDDANRQFMNGVALNARLRHRQLQVLPPAGGWLVYQDKKAALPAGVTNFLYNGLEQRVAKSGPLGTFFYAYDEAGHVLGEYDATGAPLYEVIWLGDTPVGVIRTTFSAATSTYAATIDTVFVDHLNTPRTIVNAAGSLVMWTWSYYEDPYAQITPPATATGYVFNLRMPGQIFDKETGLFHNGHRDYNPATGRYIQPDPIGLEGGINRYGYVDGNPLTGTDSMGLANSSAVKWIPLKQSDWTHPESCNCPTPPSGPPGACIAENIDIAKEYSALNPGSMFGLYDNVKNYGPWDYKRKGREYENFGNFNFGAVTAAMGVPLYIAQNGAGIYQQWKGAADAGVGTPFLKWPYGDDIKDAVEIERGRQYAKCGCR
jgi:RHS repeat-associated protein